MYQTAVYGFGTPKVYFVTIFGAPKVHYVIILNSLDRHDLLQESPFVYNFGQLLPFGCSQVIFAPLPHNFTAFLHTRSWQKTECELHGVT